MTEQQQIVPHSRDAERALLGALLIAPDGIDLIDLEPSELYIHRHQWIYDTLRALHRKGIDPDQVTLCEVFERDGRLQEIGGAAYLAELVNAAPWSTNAAGYAAVIRDYARRRMMLAVANKIAGAAYEMGQPIDKPITEAIDELGKASAAKRGARHISEFVSELYDEVSELIQHPRDVWGIPTGFTDIDGLIGGLQPGEVFYLAGEPGVGKSKLMLDISLRMSKSGHPGAIFSLEMSGRAMTRRALSIVGKYPTRLLKSGKLTDDEITTFTHSVDDTANLPLYMSDDASLTLTGLRAELSRLKAQHDIEWFALDYLLLLSGYDDRDDTERSGKLSTGVKRIARDLDLPALTVNSVTKDGMAEGAPMSRNLRGSGQVVHDADVIAFLVRDKDQPSYLKLVFTKTRDVEGGARSVDLYQHSDYPGFDNACNVKLNGNGNGRVK